MQSPCRHPIDVPHHHQCRQTSYMHTFRNWRIPATASWNSRSGHTNFLLHMTALTRVWWKRSYAIGALRDDDADFVINHGPLKMEFDRFSSLEKKAPNDHFILSVIGSTRCKTPTDRVECASILWVANRESLQLLRSLSLALSPRYLLGRRRHALSALETASPTITVKWFFTPTTMIRDILGFFCGASN